VFHPWGFPPPLARGLSEALVFIVVPEAAEGAEADLPAGPGVSFEGFAMVTPGATQLKDLAARPFVIPKPRPRAPLAPGEPFARPPFEVDLPDPCHQLPESQYAVGAGAYIGAYPYPPNFPLAPTTHPFPPVPLAPARPACPPRAPPLLPVPLPSVGGCRYSAASREAA